jgi:hypothetical protein
MPHFKKLTEKQKIEIEKRIKYLLHASRDALRNRFSLVEAEFYNVRHDKALKGADMDAFHNACDAISKMNDKRWQMDPKRVAFSVNDGWYGEAFGVLRGLELLGYGTINNIKEKTYHNLLWWFNQLKAEVLVEDGFQDGSHRCDICLKAWGKDGAGRTRQTHPEIANASV